MDFFLNNAKDFARNPLGIIALFISLIYGFANLLLVNVSKELTSYERWPLIVFIVLFPFAVLFTFYRLVTNHHGKLYAPKDFNDDKSFLRTLSFGEKLEKLKKDIKEQEVTENGKVSTGIKKLNCEFASVQTNLPNSEDTIIKEILEIENKVSSKLALEFKNVEIMRNISIGSLNQSFDFFLQKISGKFTFAEVKYVKKPSAFMHMWRHINRHALIVNSFFESEFKLIIILVCDFEESRIQKYLKYWIAALEACSIDIELWYIEKSKLDKSGFKKVHIKK